MHIRRAHHIDLDAIVANNVALAWETEHQSLHADRVRSGVRAVLQNPGRRGQYYIAQRDGKVIGQLLVQLLFNDWRNGLVAWIDNVYVAPDHRAQGVFAALFGHVKRLVSSKAGVIGFRLQVLETNSKAQRAYGKHRLRYHGYVVMERFWPEPASLGRTAESSQLNQRTITPPFADQTPVLADR